MTAKNFAANVERCLAPTLKRKGIIMIDNLPAHKAAAIREAIEARGSTLRFLPKYSPDLSPIEMPFSQLGERTIRWRKRPARAFFAAKRLNFRIVHAPSVRVTYRSTGTNAEGAYAHSSQSTPAGAD
jgi:transposase